MALIVFSGCAPAPPSPADPGAAASRKPDLRDTWNAGDAEIGKYRLRVSAHGQLQEGALTTITSSVPFSRSAQAEVVTSEPASSDAVRAVKLSILRTGISGDRKLSTMTTAFVSSGGALAGMPFRVTYSSQRWEGQSWSQALFTPGYVHQIRHSDLLGDSQRSLEDQTPSTSEDVLLLAARRIAWPRLRLGQSRDTLLLSSLSSEQERQVPLSFSNVTLTLSRERYTTTVPFGRVRTNAFTARWTNSRQWICYVEADPPFRVIRWEDTSGEQAELLSFSATEKAVVRAPK